MNITDFLFLDQYFTCFFIVGKDKVYVIAPMLDFEAGRIGIALI